MDSGEKFGLQPIGTSGIDESAPKNDSTRSAFPALATKGSVFAWKAPSGTLYNKSSGVNYTEVVNIRQNTATGGSSYDVPAWAAGALLCVLASVNTMGAGVTSHNFYIYSSFITAADPLGGVVHQTTLTSVNDAAINQVIVPFFDEPIFSVQQLPLGALLGSVQLQVYLLGFVRNV